MSDTKYYKVLRAGRSCHGGEMKWSLPKNGKPGKWHEVTGNILICSSGIHLTSEPAVWWGTDDEMECYEVEHSEVLDTRDDKVVVRRARLLRRLSDDGLIALRIFKSGRHRVDAGVTYAYGSATVTAYDSATVRAYGSATVTASGSATVTASGSATVTAYGSATVTAYGSATVRAYDSATVTAYDSATVRAYGSATVEAYDSATVTAYDSATVRAYGSATVTAYDSATVISSCYHASTALVKLDGTSAVHVDRRTNPPTCRAGGVA